MAKDPSDNKYLLSDVLKWLASLAGRIGTYCANGAPSGRLLWAGLGQPGNELGPVDWFERGLHVPRSVTS
jgi:hypothetical protein